MVSSEYGTALFHIADYVVLVLMLIISLAIGLYYAYKSRHLTSSKDYFMAGGMMGTIPTGFSLLASALCSIWYIGLPTEIYYYGFHFFTDFICIPIAMGIVSVGILPLFYDLKVTSANEYLERRFNKVVRICGSLLYIFNSLLYVSLVMFVPALSVSQVTGLHLWLSMSMMCIVGTVYTAAGGIRAVMWTDVFQMVIIYASLVAIIVKGSIDNGGVSTVFEKAIEGGRLKLTPISLDPRYRYNIYIVIASSFTYWLGLYGSYQTQIQRYLSCPSQKSAVKALWLNLPAYFPVLISLVYIGMLLYTAFAECDPEQSGAIKNMDEILIHYVMSLFTDYPGLPGLFVAGVFSGALSTISSYLNSLSAVTMEDFVLTVPSVRQMNEETKIKISRGIALGYGLLTMLFMLVIQHMQSIIEFYMYNNGAVAGCLSGIFMLGMFVPWANAFGAIAAFLLGGGLSFAYVLGCQLSGSTFEPERLSLEGCDANLLNETHSFSNETVMAVENITLYSMTTSSASSYFISSEPLYRNAHNSFAYLELFSMSPMLVQPLTFFLVILLGAIFSALYRIGHHHDVDPKLISPLVRRWVARTDKVAHADHRLAPDEEVSKEEQGKSQELQSFLRGRCNSTKPAHTNSECFIFKA